MSRTLADLVEMWCASSFPAPHPSSVKIMKAIRAWLLVFVIGLVLSGVTAFPLVTEVRVLTDVLHAVPAPDALVAWIDRVREGLEATGTNYPFIAYGTDWLAFAHLMIAIAFWGPWRDPVRNIWVIEWGMICCLAIIPLALIAGPIRELPWWWLLIDMSFGVFGIIPLIVVRRLIKRMATDSARSVPNVDVGV
ncbi:hypothetical protein SAMN05421748_123152 [Paractinoplanes atraurantiacus]|uniref:Cytoplasmic membrane protein n=2 Tax=Paractinoplanes atraurantiacus TaxID=1036182 RepID=A0A285JSX9_9ACTN|nr:hypothetical protein SAMN05421748_123152 [Actinoplanes atraurantiacus]